MLFLRLTLCTCAFYLAIALPVVLIELALLRWGGGFGIHFGGRIGMVVFTAFWAAAWLASFLLSFRIVFGAYIFKAAVWPGR